MWSDQLGLLLWKNYVIRKRRPGMLALLFLWPVVVFLILYTFRDNTDPEYNPTCQFPGRLMPQTEFLPFLQNYICTVGNPCEPLSEYEKVPAYRNSKLGPLLHTLQPLLKNETILNAAKDLPKSITFLRSMAEVLTRPGVKQIFERGIHFGDLFKDHDEVRKLVKQEIPELRPVVVDNFLNASIKIQYLVEALGSSNMDGIICSPQILKEFLILPTDEDLSTVSKALCGLNSTLIPDLVQHVVEQLDFDGMFGMINLVMAKFRTYDIFSDIQQTVDSILSLKMMDLIFPEKLRLRKWLPNIIPLFKNVTFKEIDLSFIPRAIDLLDPVFVDEYDWPTARKAILKFNSMLELAKDLTQNKTNEKISPNGIFEMTTSIVDILNTSIYSHNSESVGEIMDNAWAVLQGGVKLTKTLIWQNENNFEMGAEVLDGLTNFFPKKILNPISYLVSLTDIVVQTVHHVAKLHLESSRRVWNISQNYTTIVRPILAMNSSIYRTVVESFSRLDIVQDFVEVNKNAGEIFCETKMFNRIFNASKKVSSQDTEAISLLLCGEEGRRFLAEIYNSFEINNFERNVKNMLSTFVYAAAGQPVPISNSNITSLIRSIKHFVTYLETPRPSEAPGWKELAPSDAWSDTFKDTSARGRLDVLGIHLSVARKVGMRSFSFTTIMPTLENIDHMAKMIVQTLETEAALKWTKEVDEDVPLLVDTFYLTAADRQKVLRILEISNFTATYCNDENYPPLINYLKGSNETRLKNDICHLSQFIESRTELDASITIPTTNNTPVSPTPFNWTTFNDRLIRIYREIDLVIHQIYPDLRPESQRERLIDEFIVSWTKNVSVSEGFEVSIGLLCKLGEMSENGFWVFGFTRAWDFKNLKIREISNIFQALQDRLTIIKDKNMTSRVNLRFMPETGILEEIVLRNIQDGLTDLVDMLTLKMPNISALIDYKNRETSWPCVKEQSIGEVLAVRNGTRNIIREIERIACNPGSFINEWQQTFEQDINTERDAPRPFNWTEGYTRFRKLMADLRELSPDTNILSDQPSVSLTDVKRAFESAKKFIDSKFTDKSVWNDILTGVDNQLNNLIDKSNYSIWTTDKIEDPNYNVDPLSRLIALAKYAGHVIHEMSTVALSIVNKGPVIDAFSVLGFGDRTPLKIVYSHLPDLIAMFVNGLASSSIMRKISLASKNPYGGPACVDVFDWFGDFRNGISVDEYQILKNCICNFDPTNFNDFTNVILTEEIIRGQPVKDYPLFAGRSIFKLYELGEAIKTASKTGVKVPPPFTVQYWDVVFRNLTHELERHHSIQRVVSVDSTEPFHVAVEFAAEILRHLATSLNKLAADEKLDGFHLWDLVEDGDIRQLFKVLESHPTESIALAASLAQFEPETGHPTVFSGIKMKMCDHHFNSGYWNNSERVHFLRTICSFDPYQLLKSLTSQEFYDLIQGPNKNLQRESSLSEYLANVISASFGLSRSHPSVKFKTNIFNVTTWRNLDNNTWSIIENTEESWLRDYLQLDSSGMEEWNPTYPSPRIAMTERFDYFIQLSNLLVNLASGGDMWSKLRTLYESNPEMNATLSLAEGLPNLMLTIVNTFFNGEITNSSVGSLIDGKVNLCEFNKYLIEPRHMQGEGFLGNFTQSCQRMSQLKKTGHFLFEDIFEQTEGTRGTLPGRNESSVMNHIRQLQKIIIRTISEGQADFKPPKFITSFIVGNLNNFVAEYEAMDPHVLVNSTAHQMSKLLQSLIEATSRNNNCAVCEGLFNFLRILNGQLSNHALYEKLVYSSGKLNAEELRDILFNKLKWTIPINDAANINGRFIASKNIFADLSNEMEKTMQYLTEIALGFFDTTKGNASATDNSISATSILAKPTTYIGLLRVALVLLNEHVTVIDTLRTHEKLIELGKLSETSVPIWKPIEEVVVKSDVDIIERMFGPAFINVNMINTNATKSEMDLYDSLVSKKLAKFLRYSDNSTNFSSITDIPRQLSKSLDLDKIRDKLPGWRKDATKKLLWLKNILSDLDMIALESGNMLNIASTINFDGDVLENRRLLDDVMKLLREETIDKFFNGFNTLLDDVEPFIENPLVKNDLRTALSMLESMEIFKNLGLLNTKYEIKKMFPNWPVMRSYLIKTVGLSTNTTEALGPGKVDMLSVYSKESRTVSIKETICSPEKLGEIFEFETGNVTMEEISDTLCQLGSERAQNITVNLIKKLNFGSLFKDVMGASVKNILSNANLNEKEGMEIINNLGFAAKLAPLLKDAAVNMSDQFTADYLIANDTNNEASLSTNQDMNFPQFLKESGEMLCGKSMVQDTGKFFKIISQIEENGAEFNDVELASLPTDSCKDVYKEISKIAAGKILWTYVKPLLRGRILYAPRTSFIDKVMEETNSTFAHIGNFGVLIDSFERSMTSLANMTELGDSLIDLQKIFKSKLMKIAVKSFSGTSLGIDLENFDLAKLAWRIKNSHTLIRTIRMLNKVMDCVLANRIIGFASEEELEKEADRLVGTNDFLAGIVFVEDRAERSKRSYEQGSSDNITYKIRMDVDSVPSTSRLKNQFWTPGPEGSFVENLRYLRGFIQLQDSVDRAIIKVKTQTQQQWKTVSQQMPYPCWKFVQFQSALYESQGLQVCFFFALMLCVGTVVRHIVWERESQNAMVMSVMGLKSRQNTFAWFIVSIIELSVVAIIIFTILMGGKILPRSDPLLVLFLLLDYVFATVTFCYMISTMFSSASLAAVTTVVFFLLTYMPYIIVIAMEASVNLAVKLLMCLNMSTSFCFGCLYAVRKEVQGTGLTWASMWEESSPGDPMSLGLVFLTIAFDGCLYALIGYIITRYTNSDSDSDATNFNVQDEKQVGVRFDNVRKVYQTETGECVAVDDFSIKLMEGEVTTLLGRNGAGKTTIIKMLTGMEAPTSGEIWLPNNNDAVPHIGVCPQTNVLIGCLTAREHMMFYARLKNRIQGYDMDRDIETMLTSMELNGQEDELVSKLSGGTQRRLCVCLAFIGAPNLVILDEPGAGVDPAARRRIWRLIDKHRIGRTVLMSTHYLDEADMLSDTVVVIHKGKILSTGSPLTLKINYGQGYRMTVSFSSPSPKAVMIKDNEGVPMGQAKTMSNLTNLVEKIVPNATVNDVSDTEVEIILPFQRSPGDANDIAGAVKALEDNQEQLGFSHFNLECDTLERVFLDMCAHADGAEKYAKPTSLESLNSVNSIGFAIPTENVDLITNEPSMKPSVFRQGKALLKKRLWHFARDWRAPLAALILPTLFVAVAMGLSLIRPPSDDQRPLVLSTKLYDTHPVHFYSIDRKSDQFHKRVSLQLQDRFVDASNGNWRAFSNDTGSCDCIDGDQVCEGLPAPVEGLIETNPGRATLDWIISTQEQYIEKRYGGWSLNHMDSEDGTGVFVVWYNNKGHHSLPAYLNALNEAILRASGVSGHLTTINHPLKSSRDQLNRTTLLQHVADVGIGLVLLVAFSLVGAQGAKELVRERLSEEKRILYLAGVKPLTYWTTALIWDLLVFAVSILLAVIVFEIFGLSAYVAKENLPSVCVLLFLYAWAVIPFTHLAEKMFDDSSLSNMVLFCLNTFIGVLSLATILTIDVLGTSKTAEDVRNFLHQLLLIFPQYALGDGLVRISTNDITANLLERFHMNTYKSPLSWDLLGPHCLYLFMVGAILFATNLAIESRALPAFRDKKVPLYATNDEDEDVAKERARIEKGLCQKVLKTIRLRKVYESSQGKNVAVHDLSFGIQAGECFGLFGVNGAGKSTTFKMLTTEIIPTAGQVVLNDKEIGSGPLCSGDVGYCPQSDALDPFLTPHQSLTIHGEVSGLRNVPRAVETALKRFDLTKYAHQRVASLSGGNKRKLNAAISVLLPSRVVLMDEATSGMDPASKDLVAKAIKSIIKNRGSVLMTSHSVADCENLCTRVGVLAKAGLKCIGSPQYLKHRYGEGYIVFLRFKGPTLLSELLESTARHLPGASIASRQAVAARLLVPRKPNTKLSSVLASLRDLATELNAVDYTLTQSSLDQVLVNFSEEFDDADRIFENMGSSGSRHRFNVQDAIHMDTIRNERFTSLPIS
ncbi:ATP-binding cassette sub-family A member 13 isoform X2 [Athalia rosae]|uniref:ATP-binding cassette sub-family A member 13 isoform X2 n=1 Tax=Athalia rosae TaxID=37344 RepID=UPI002033DDA5|nr:ATP-binding cassette sub-family A member 13 isoform X2 [Athalia rosae]